MTTYQTNLQSTNHQISISHANSLIKRFAENRDSILEGDFIDADPFTISQTFDKIQIQSLLDQTGCIGLRSYFGMYNDQTDTDRIGKIVLVLCGVDENGNDLNLEIGNTNDVHIIMEDGQVCPPFCNEPSQINI